MVDISEAEYDEMTAVNAKTAFFFLKEAGKHLNDNGKICTLVTSLLGAFTPFYAAYAGTKAPVEHFTRAAAKEFGERGISVTAVGPGPMDTPFFYPAEGADAVAYHKTAAALSPFSKTGLTDIEDVVPFIRHGQRRLVGNRPNHPDQRRLHHQISSTGAQMPHTCSRATAPCGYTLSETAPRNSR